MKVLQKPPQNLIRRLRKVLAARGPCRDLLRFKFNERDREPRFVVGNLNFDEIGNSSRSDQHRRSGIRNDVVASTSYVEELIVLLRAVKSKDKVALHGDLSEFRGQYLSPLAFAGGHVAL
jgi:hypothetical protein